MPAPQAVPVSAGTADGAHHRRHRLAEVLVDGRAHDGDPGQERRDDKLGQDLDAERRVELAARHRALERLADE